MKKQEKYISIKDTRIHYIIEGKGKPVLFLHGWPGNISGLINNLKNLFSFDSELETLSKKFFQKYKIIGLDWPGFGKSNELKEKYSLEYLADFLNEFMEELKIKKCNVVAISMGGYISLTAQNKYQNLFNRMIIFGLTKDLSHHFLFNFARIAAKTLGRKLSICIVDLIKRINLLTNFIQYILFPKSYKKVKQSSIYLENAKRISSRVHYEIIKELTKNDLLKGVNRGISIPITFIGAESDPMLPIKKIKVFASSFEKSKVIAVKGDDHSPFAHIDKRVGLYKILLRELLKD